MTMNKAATWSYCEQVGSNASPLIDKARFEAEELGITSVNGATGQFLTTLASLPHIKTIAEIGTGTGVSALYFFNSGRDIVLTSIDIESEAQNYAREFFTAAGLRPSRYRLINGRSVDLLPRLADNSYDLVLIDGDPLEAGGDVAEAIRMLRSGGILIVLHALQDDRVADPAKRDDETVAMRNLGLDLIAAEEMETTILPLGDGIIFAIKK
ncbi:O-methyltransferase [Arcanobacterium hippocoleae]|uniref:O-methyltransferase YrrM n=1 Tax=Arcanobacterium hippocoleae TaxID=149017 RepID=A0ABU1SZW7_9ACTO|nr:class I SAM-dependent methyltransferase [Arcanobacterium hippocoleae]MDR6938648.1 putative O-methyltransferase YrrM [Arcanobacterium hippocoleae]